MLFKKEENTIVNVSLTKSQCKNLCDFIDCNIFDYVRRDEEVDNIFWLADMIEAYRKLLEVNEDE